MTMTPQDSAKPRFGRIERPPRMVGNRADVASSPIDFSGFLTALKRSASNKRRFLTIFVPFRSARMLAPAGPMWQEPAA
jgi:hypothetical protein